MITQKRAQELSEKWGEDKDALAQFGMTGEYKPEWCMVYLSNIERQITAPAFFPRPYEHTKSNSKELEQLEKYFTKLCPYQFEWRKHQDYGFRIPVVINGASKVYGAYYPI